VIAALNAFGLFAPRRLAAMGNFHPVGRSIWQRASPWDSKLQRNWHFNLVPTWPGELPPSLPTQQRRRMIATIVVQRDADLTGLNRFPLRRRHSHRGIGDSIGDAS